MNFFSDLPELKPREFRTTWESPSNIAFVKYWGKIGHQIPANPSYSMTLKNCVTKTSLHVTPASALKVDLYLEDRPEPKFAQKIQTYLEGLSLPALSKLHFEVRTSNSFPHGAGIASSASGLSAFVLGLTEYIHQGLELPLDSVFYERAGHLSRLASGSACRSLYGGFTSWGDHSNFFATPETVHPTLAKLKDAVVVVSCKEKAVSSRAGHDRMKEHFFAEARFTQAKANYKNLKLAMNSGDFSQVGLILENEALSLHAMMMTAPEAFTLLRPESLGAMEMVRAFRMDSKIPVYFTLDAGPNLHLIYRPEDGVKVETFIRHELSRFSESVIFDEVGSGPRRC